VLDVQLHTATGWDDTNLQSSPHSKKSPEHGTMDDISSGSEILPPNILRMLLPPQNVPPCTEEKEMRIKKVHPYMLSIWILYIYVTVYVNIHLSTSWNSTTYFLEKKPYVYFLVAYLLVYGWMLFQSSLGLQFRFYSFFVPFRCYQPKPKSYDLKNHVTLLRCIFILLIE